MVRGRWRQGQRDEACQGGSWPVAAGILLVLVMLTAGCAQVTSRFSPPPAAPTASGAQVTQAGLTLPAGYTVTVVAEGLQGPT